jgi:PAS domain S-box-containing protein
MRRREEKMTMGQDDVSDRSDLLGRAFDSLGHPTLLLDREGTIVAANEAAQLVYGQNRFALRGAKCRELLCGQGEMPEGCPVREIFEAPNEGPRTRELTALGRSFHVTCAPVLDGAGKVECVVHSAVDLTDRKDAEQQLRATEQHHEWLTSHVADAIFVTDLAMQWIWVSDSVEKLRGFTAEQTKAQPISEVLTPRSLRTAKATLSQELLKEQTEDPAAFQPYVMDLEFTCKDGSTVWAELKLTFTRDAEGQATGIVGVARDITSRRLAQAERAELEGQLHRAQRMEAVGRLAGGVAHDFNNMLSVVLGYTALLQVDAEPGSQTAEDIDEIERAIDRAAHLTRQLLTFSKRQISSPVSLDLNEVVSDLQKMLSRIVGEDIELQSDLANDLDPILADRSHVEQVLANLAVNARDAMPRGGKLSMQTANVRIGESEAKKILDLEPGTYVRLVVSDDGMGMPRSVLERIFEPFYTTKHDGKGTGLGLSTVYGIVKQSDGHIFVESAPREGTRFSIFFPKHAPEARITAPPPSRSAGKTKGLTVLVVEDEEPLRRLICRALKGQGHRAIEAEHAEAALAAAHGHEGTIDVLLTDLILPGPSGVALAEQIQEALPDVAVVYMSGHSDEVVAEHGMLEEGIVFLPKPFGPSQLADKIAEALSE